MGEIKKKNYTLEHLKVKGKWHTIIKLQDWWDGEMTCFDALSKNEFQAIALLREKIRSQAELARAVRRRINKFVRIADETESIFCRVIGEISEENAAKKHPDIDMRFSIPTGLRDKKDQKE